VKAFCEGISAVAALSATVFWFAAASHPVGVPGPRPYMPEDVMLSTSLLKSRLFITQLRMPDTRRARSRFLDARATRTRLRDSRGDVFALSALEAPDRSLEQSEAAVPKSPLIFKKDKLHRPKIKLGYAVFKRRRLSGQTPIRRTSRYRARG
jgi:hypothetical protein